MGHMEMITARYIENYIKEKEAIINLRENKKLNKSKIPNIYIKLIVNKGSKTIQWGKE